MLIIVTTLATTQDFNITFEPPMSLRARIENAAVCYKVPNTNGTTIKLPKLEIRADAELVLIGPSGSGKTTLLHVLAGLLKPSSGSVEVAGENLTGMSVAKLERFRAKNIGLVFQDFHLIQGYNAIENVMVALTASGMPLKQAKKEAKQKLEYLGLTHRLTNKPKQLSTGERQRVAIARAIAANPVLLLADEPTANLDRGRAQKALELLREVALMSSAALVIATHDPLVMDTFPNHIQLS